jgi:type I restriction enzyme S subunit
MEAVKEKAQLQKYSAYRNSGVEWLGEIPEHWEIKRLGSLLKPISEKNKPELPLLSITREKGVIQRNIEDEDENHNYIPDDLSGYKVLRKGQFGMNKMKAWQGSYGISKFTGIVSPAYYVFDFYYEVDPDYFNTAIRSKKYISFFGSASDGVRIGQWDLSKTRMKQIPFILPPKQEQTAIATFLDEKCGKIDTTIVQKEKLIELLKERKQIIIQNAVTKGLDHQVKMKDSGVEWIGEIPEHWEVKKLKFSATLRSEKTISRNSSLPYLGLENIESWTGNLVETDSETEGQANRFYSGDVLFGKLRPYLAKVYLSEKDGICSGEILAFKANEEVLNSFLHKTLLSYRFIDLVDSSTYGAKMPRANPTYIQLQNIPIPGLDEQKEIVKYIDVQIEKSDKAIKYQQQQIEKLKEYKSSLIDAAVTGKIKVS